MSKRAVVLAGGTGTRLRPYTVVLPKPLMPIGDYPILEVIIRQLARQGFAQITLAVNHQANILKAFWGWKSMGVHIDYSLEIKPISTIAPLTLIPDLPENFLLMNGDVLTDFDLSGLLERHVARGRLFTIAAARRFQLIDYGVLQIDSSHRLTGFDEKPQPEYLVSMGIYAVNRRILQFVPPDSKYGFDDLMKDLLEKAERVDVSRTKVTGSIFEDRMITCVLSRNSNSASGNSSRQSAGMRDKNHSPETFGVKLPVHSDWSWGWLWPYLAFTDTGTGNFLRMSHRVKAFS
jgi:NDP-sugar pyrophosphorylase family protein